MPQDNPAYDDDISIQIAKLVRTVAPIQSGATRDALLGILHILSTMHDALVSLDGYVSSEEEEEE